MKTDTKQSAISKRQSTVQAQQKANAPIMNGTFQSGADENRTLNVLKQMSVLLQRFPSRAKIVSSCIKKLVLSNQPYIQKLSREQIERLSQTTPGHQGVVISENCNILIPIDKIGSGNIPYQIIVIGKDYYAIIFDEGKFDETIGNIKDDQKNKENKK